MTRQLECLLAAFALAPLTSCLGTVETHDIVDDVGARQPEDNDGGVIDVGDDNGDASHDGVNDVGDDSGDTSHDGAPADQARWTFLFYMNGDYEDTYTEEWISADMDYLEEVGSGGGVHVVAQGDRIPGYSSNFGDWTDARRYYIKKEAYNDELVSEVVEYLGEVDMGAPDTLSDFVLWGRKNYPAERTVLVFYTHGSGWMSVSPDHTSGSSLSIFRGELNEGLAESVRRSGPIDLVVFDACNMANWEVAHSLQGYAHYMAASERVFGEEDGIYYAESIRLVRDDPGVDAGSLADHLARIAVDMGGERTFSAVDIDTLADLSNAVDQLARAVLENESLEDPLLQARKETPSVWEGGLDLEHLGAQLQSSGDAQLVSHGQAIQGGLDTAVISAYGNSARSNGTWLSAGGLTIMFNTNGNLNGYSAGAGATWSKDTKWGELLLRLTDR